MATQVSIPSIPHPQETLRSLQHSLVMTKQAIEIMNGTRGASQIIAGVQTPIASELGTAITTVKRMNA